MSPCPKGFSTEQEEYIFLKRFYCHSEQSKGGGTASTNRRQPFSTSKMWRLVFRTEQKETMHRFLKNCEPTAEVLIRTPIPNVQPQQSQNVDLQQSTFPATTAFTDRALHIFLIHFRWFPFSEEVADSSNAPPHFYCAPIRHSQVFYLSDTLCSRGVSCCIQSLALLSAVREKAVGKGFGNTLHMSAVWNNTLQTPRLDYRSSCGNQRDSSPRFEVGCFRIRVQKQTTL